VNVLETPYPHVNFDSYTPQLPLLELRVKPDPIVFLNNLLAYGFLKSAGRKGGN
jgi:hypothetical protein